MRSPRLTRREEGSVIILLLVVLAAIGGGYWFMKQNRDMREKEALAFATEATNKIVLQHDQRFIDFNLTQKAQLTYPPSWRYRMLQFIKDAGTPNPQWHFTKTEVLFQNQFFEPQGTFIAQFDFPNGPGYFELHVSHPGALWVIDDLNWTWTPPAPTPTPTIMGMATPLPTATPSPSPSPSPTPAHKKKP